MRKLATIQKISKIEPHPNADKLEIAHVLGWNCIVGKGEFKEGELIVYFEIDSFLPIKPEFEFLRERCYKKFTDGREGFRIKTIRLRKIISQGLILSLNNLPFENKLISGDAIFTSEIGKDITELLEVVIYNPPIPAELKGEIKGQFPGFIPKTDETRIQLLQDVLTRYKGTKCYVTEKVDGTSITCYLKDGEFGVCSRNLELKETEGNAYWKAVRELKIEENLRKISNKFCTNIAIQGELIGPGIQENPLQLNERQILWFNIFDIDNYRYFSYDNFQEILHCYDLEGVPLRYVPFILNDDIVELVKMATIRSSINVNKWAEGIVIRPLIEVVDMQMASGFGNGRLSFKCINPEYLIEVEQ